MPLYNGMFEAKWHFFLYVLSFLKDWPPLSVFSSSLSFAFRPIFGPIPTTFQSTDNDLQPLNFPLNKMGSHWYMSPWLMQITGNSITVLLQSEWEITLKWMFRLTILFRFPSYLWAYPHHFPVHRQWFATPQLSTYWGCPPTRTFRSTWLHRNLSITFKHAIQTMVDVSVTIIRI
jgi:hypothetical protein